MGESEEEGSDRQLPEAEAEGMRKLPEEWLSVADAAALVGKSPRTIRLACSEDRIPHRTAEVRGKSAYRVLRGDLLTYWPEPEGEPEAAAQLPEAESEAAAQLPEGEPEAASELQEAQRSQLEDARKLLAVSEAQRAMQAERAERAEARAERTEARAADLEKDKLSLVRKMGELEGTVRQLSGGGAEAATSEPARPWYRAPAFWWGSVVLATVIGVAILVAGQIAGIKFQQAVQDGERIGDAYASVARHMELEDMLEGEVSDLRDERNEAQAAVDAVEAKLEAERAAREAAEAEVAELKREALKAQLAKAAAAAWYPRSFR